MLYIVILLINELNKRNDKSFFKKLKNKMKNDFDEKFCKFANNSKYIENNILIKMINLIFNLFIMFVYINLNNLNYFNYLIIF